MYMCAVVLLALSGLRPVNCRDSHSQRGVSYRHVPRSLSHVNTTAVMGRGDYDRCGVVALKCYTPILSYMDPEGEFCGWKNMTTFRTLPPICMETAAFSVGIWGKNALKYQYRFIKTCYMIHDFQKCVRNNQVCRRDDEMKIVMSLQNTLCDNLQVMLPVMTCKNAWDSSVNWNKLVYTDWRIVQACPATHYRQLALNSMKLFLFTYISRPSSVTDVVVESMNAEATGRYLCQSIQQKLCLYKRGDTVCQGFLPMWASQNFNDHGLINYCNSFAYNNGKCYKFVKRTCNLFLSSGHMTVKTDFPDISNLYNMTYWHRLGYSEVDILLHTDNKGIGHCDVGNLIFKQIGCFHQYITQIDMNRANHSDYLTEYMCNRIKLYNSCFEVYINSSCPDEAKQFQGIRRSLHLQCDILRVANINATCPLHGVYSDDVFNKLSWFSPIMYLMRVYVTVIKWKQMNLAPSGWRDEILSEAYTMITFWKSELIKGEQMRHAVNYENDVISTVCDQETAAVFKEFVTLSTGDQYYQFINHVIKGFEYIKSLVQ